MELAHLVICWYHQAYYDVDIIDSYGSFPNVPLIGTKGGINYNFVLARCQLGYSIRYKPNNIHLSGFFLKEGEDRKEDKDEIAKAWCHIHRKSRKDLGPRGLFLWSLIFSGYKQEPSS